MHKLIIIQIYLIIVLLFSSCEKVLETNIAGTPLLCFNCILNPDSTVKAHLSFSRSISGVDEFQKIDGAIIELRKDGKLLDYLKNESEGIYTCDEKPMEGGLYEVNVQAKGYKSLNASTRIPNKPKVTFDKSAPILEPGHGLAEVYTYSVTYSISDRLSINRYWHYKISKFAGIWHFYGGYGGIDSPFFDNFNKVIDSTYKNGYFYEYYLRINDSGFENQSFSFHDTHYSSHSIVSFFMDTDEHYDKYLKSTIKQKMNDGDNLLFNEPVQIYSNIENGLGIFGSAAITSFKL